MFLEQSIYKFIFQKMPSGLMIINSDKKILDWNDWLLSKTGLKPDDVVGNRIEDIFKDHNFTRFNWALENLFSFGAPQVMSQILNKYLIPIHLVNSKDHNEEYMQQHIQILPVKDNQNWIALVVIEDVTQNVHQRNVLMDMAYKLEEESFRDALTGIYNRRFLWEYLEKQIREASVTNQDMACLMMDIDHFKSVNDKYGHEQGDEVLKTFVNLIKDLVRRSDLFVRYGGEEFILLMPNSPFSVAYEKANIILQVVEKNIVNSAISFPITCSIGLSMWTSKTPEVSGEILVSQADKALYRAKQNGRNRVECFVHDAR